MRRRILAVTLVAILVLLGFGTSAAAKGPDSATISGPGVGTVKLTWSRPDHVSLSALLQTTRLYEGASALWKLDPPSGDLGSKFSVAYHVDDGEPIRQDAYPFATAGPIVYMPSGQTMYGMDLPYGWLSVDDRLTRVLTRLGAKLEPKPTVVEPAAQVSSPSTGESDSTSGWGMAAAGAVAVGLLATVTVGRSRRGSRSRLAG